MKKKASNFDQKILEQQQDINMPYPPGVNNNIIRELSNQILQNPLEIINLRSNINNVSSFIHIYFLINLDIESIHK